MFKFLDFYILLTGNFLKLCGSGLLLLYPRVHFYNLPEMKTRVNNKLSNLI